MRQLFLYGPPSSGKTTLGKLLAERLSLPFVDLDWEIGKRDGRTIPQIFAEEGEAGFRAIEKRTLEEVIPGPLSVIALGGGTLLDGECRRLAESQGLVLCLECPLEELKRRIRLAPGTRPLVAGGEEEAERRLTDLIGRRSSHYASFPVTLDVADWNPEFLTDEAATIATTVFGAFRIDSGDQPSDVLVGCNLLDTLGARLAPRGFGRRCVVVADSNTAPLYAERVSRSLTAVGFVVSTHVISAGETDKNLATVSGIWQAFLAAGLSRSDFAVAVGGGVVGDLTGFAAATWMRGMRWVNVSTTLLSMVDASTGGKTGCDLPEAKNMVGAFHSPSLVLIDANTLSTLPPREFRCGLAEALKHGFISGNRELCGSGLDKLPESVALAAYVFRALAVKVDCVRQDPFEHCGVRAKLNLGHTIGHAVEIATDFQVKHGEAVAIGTVEEARLAVRLGLAPADWPEEVAAVFASAGLPTTLPEGLDFEALKEIMRRDKKKQDGCVRFALPLGWGKVDLVPVEL